MSSRLPPGAQLSDSDWHLVNSLFAEAAALDPAARHAFLEEWCRDAPAARAELESLLQFRAAAGRLDADAAEAVADAATSLGAALPFDRIGPYRLVSEIGSGGMGTVYLAERAGDGFTQRVAIKVVRGLLGQDGLRRFRTERRVLAALEHPNVARLIDGGTTDAGLPYLVMELIDGEPIDRYCHARGLSLRARLDLFMRVCDAVTYAHRNLIVHRDLKPSNILVTGDGTPKLLDFGIAKLLDDDGADAMLATSASMRVMTPEYASPEQLRGAPVTTASDVYSLGVLLFELLAGQRPYAFTSREPHAIAALVSFEEPRKPSTVAEPRMGRELRGDLDTIILTALRKEPARRYPTVEQLADDLRRFSNGHPIHARPATWRYRSSRFLSRHLVAVTTAALVAIVIAGFGAALARSAARTAQERDAAERVTALLVDMFTATDPAQQRGGNITARELLDRGAARIESGLQEQPQVRAQLLDALGSVYFALGVWEPAQALLTNAMTARHQVGEVDSLRTATTMHRLADVMLWRGQNEAAAALIASTLEIRRRAHGGTHPDIAASLALQARAYSQLGRPWSQIEPLYQQAIDIWRSTADSPDVAVSLVQLARGRNAEARYTGAIEAAEQALAIRRRAFGDDHPLTLESIVTVAQALHQSGRVDASEPYSREVAERRRRLYRNDDHPFVHQAINQLALVLADQGRLSEAEPLARIAAERSRAALGVFNGTASNLRTLGAILEDQGRYAEAEAAYRESLQIGRKAPSAEQQVGMTLAALARFEVLRGQTAPALTTAAESVSILERRYGTNHVQTGPALTSRAIALGAARRVADADTAFTETIALQRARLPEHHPQLVSSLTAFGVFLLEQGRADRAAPLLAEAHRAQQASLPKGHWSSAWTEFAYGTALRALGRAEGRAVADAGWNRLAGHFPPDDPHLRHAIRLSKLF